MTVNLTDCPACHEAKNEVELIAFTENEGCRMHRICKACANAWIAWNVGNGKTKVPCPTCRTERDVSDFPGILQMRRFRLITLKEAKELSRTMDWKYGTRVLFGTAAVATALALFVLGYTEGVRRVALLVRNKIAIPKTQRYLEMVANEAVPIARKIMLVGVGGLSLGALLSFSGVKVYRKLRELRATRIEYFPLS